MNIFAKRQKQIFMKRYFFPLVCFLMFYVSGYARNGFRVMFYNVENFFDCTHDSLKSDREFLPDGIRGWTPARFWRKAGNIAKVISAVGEDRFPEIVGLAEVENEHCIQSLLYGSPLKNAHYSYVHEESSDARGVDVCLLYNRYLFSLIRYKAIKMVFEGEPAKKTRDVLYVCGKTLSADTLHIFVCHLPSRLGGELESEVYRRAVANLIRKETDRLLQGNRHSRILIMGDFNDYPADLSLSVDLGARSPDPVPDPLVLYNLMRPMCGKPDTGTNKHQSEWGILDQMLVSGTLLTKNSGCRIFDADFLLVQDERWLGRKPFRTFYGMVYQGGFSDHLPVYADFDF